MGKFDSSLTRVQPILNALYNLDSTGSSWLKNLLKLGNRSTNWDLGQIDLSELVEPPKFEFSAHPPKSFLKWLLENPNQLTIPDDKFWKKWSLSTKEKRKVLLSCNKKVLQQAFKELGKGKIPDRVWWRLEGVTKVDCAFLTSTTVIFIEGKRTELGASKNILWYPNRNQVLRNLDCAEEYARIHGFKNFFIMLIVEKDLFESNPRRQQEAKDILNPETIAKSLPHLTAERREKLLSHYLGVTTWQDIAESFNLDQTLLINHL